MLAPRTVARVLARNVEEITITRTTARLRLDDKESESLTRLVD
jgi:hypothetical protein